MSCKQVYYFRLVNIDFMSCKQVYYKYSNRYLLAFKSLLQGVNIDFLSCKQVYYY